MGHKQQPLRSKGEAGGAFIVISGIVRLTGQTADGMPLDEAYLAAGRLCATQSLPALAQYLDGSQQALYSSQEVPGL